MYTYKVTRLFTHVHVHVYMCMNVARLNSLVNVCVDLFYDDVNF